MSDPRADVGPGYDPGSYLASALTMRDGTILKVGDKVLFAETGVLAEVVGFGGMSFGQRFGQVVDVRVRRGWWIFEWWDHHSPLIGELCAA